MVKHVILWQLKDELSEARSRALWKCMSTSTVFPLLPPT